MPQPDLPPTPAASADIIGKQRRPSKDPQTSFAFPPPAMSESRSSISTSPEASSSTSASSYHPMSPVSPAVKLQSNSPRHKRTASGGKKPLPKDDFDLPPPPTRTRKIIQMQPRPSAPEANATSAPTKTTAAPPSKRKNTSSSSVAGRKIARRTAHSIIERRRRSKINEEFDTLKNMIPACEGQEMHKLAILQASIDYTRYLENCIKDLKGHSDLKQDLQRESCDQEYHCATKSALASPFVRAQDPYPRPSTALSVKSPAMPASVSSSRPESVITESSIASTPTFLSPAFHAIHFSPELQRQQIAHSNNTSPHILPQAVLELDQDHHDATTALMMLNNDRRGPGTRSINDIVRESGESEAGIGVMKRRPMGLSVKDLLSG